MNTIDFTKVISLLVKKAAKKDVIPLAVIIFVAVLIDHGMTLKHDQNLAINTAS